MGKDRFCACYGEKATSFAPTMTDTGGYGLTLIAGA